MKIATVLSVSALLAMFGAVACSSPTVPADGSDKSDSADSKGDEKDSKTKDTKSSTSNTTSNTGNTTTGNTTTTGDASEAACKTCLSAEPKYKAGMECAAKCAKDDRDCADKCFTDAGCDFEKDNDVCIAIEEKCDDKCAPPPPTDAEVKECSTCMAANPQAAAFDKCMTEAKSEADEDKCFDLECDANCQKVNQQCASKCGGGGGDE